MTDNWEIVVVAKVEVPVTAKNPVVVLLVLTTLVKVGVDDTAIVEVEESTILFPAIK